MRDTNLFVLFLLLTIWIDSIHAPKVLSWSIYSCQLFYDRSNIMDNTDNAVVCYTTPEPMPCNCHDDVYLNPLVDGVAANIVHLTDYSYFDFTLKLDRPNLEFWALSRIQFAWGPAEDSPLNATSEISIHDINDGQDKPVSFYDSYNSGTGLNSIVINPVEWVSIATYAAARVRFNFKWNSPTVTGTIEPAYIIIAGTNVTKNPTESPTRSPSKPPSKSPSINPTKFPSKSPTGLPSVSPTQHPTTYNPTYAPSTPPTYSFVRRK
eukprot:13725_1